MLAKQKMHFEFRSRPKSSQLLLVPVNHNLSIKTALHDSIRRPVGSAHVARPLRKAVMLQRDKPANHKQTKQKHYCFASRLRYIIICRQWPII